MYPPSIQIALPSRKAERSPSVYDIREQNKGGHMFTKVQWEYHMRDSGSILDVSPTTNDTAATDTTAEIF